MSRPISKEATRQLAERAGLIVLDPDDEVSVDLLATAIEVHDPFVSPHAAALFVLEMLRPLTPGGDAA